MKTQKNRKTIKIAKCPLSARGIPVFFYIKSIFMSKIVRNLLSTESQISFTFTHTKYRTFNTQNIGHVHTDLFYNTISI